MRRLQIILEEWQYQYLAEEAQRRGESISAIVRRWITEKIEAQRRQSVEDDPAWKVVGMVHGSDPKAGVEHDKYIY